MDTQQLALSPSPKSNAPTPTTAPFPSKLEFLFRPSRYKIAHGGRGGAKSWGFARALLIMGTQKPLRVLCAREFQNSITDSVHKLLTDQISELKLESLYDVQQAQIIGPNGTHFNFEGIRNNVRKIKSYEGVDVCWVEEANNVSKSSWDTLIPTIRKENSEIWVSFNPELETDETYQRFVVHPPESATVVEINWRDNPWFPEVLRKEKDHLKIVDFDSYLNVWEGKCRLMLAGAVYAQELRDCQLENRFRKVPYDKTLGVQTFWDLGWADMTSIWFAQAIGFEYRIIDYYQNSQKPLDHYLQVIQNRGYLIDTCWLPHDAQAKSLGTGRSVEELVRAKGFRPRIVPRLSVEDGINAARTIFGQCYFDQEKCSDGIQALRHYRYEVLENNLGLSKAPVHDWSSHGADAFRYLAVGLREPKNKINNRLTLKVRNAFQWPQTLGWMR